MADNLFQSALVTDVPFMSEILSNQGEYYTNYKQKDWSLLGEEADKLFNEYGVTDYTAREQFTANNPAYLKQQLEAHKLYQESEKNLDEAGFIPSTLAHLGAGVVNPINYALGAGTYKLAGGVVNKLITAESTALNIVGQTTKAALAGATDIGIQEYAVETQASAFDEDKFKTIVGVGALLSGAVGGLAQTLTSASTHQRATILKGVDAMATNENEMLSPIGKAMFDVQAQLLKSKNQLAREEALKLEHSTIAVGDRKAGIERVQASNTAKDIKNKAENTRVAYMNDVMARQKESKQHINQFLEDEYTEKMKFDYLNGEKPAAEAVVKMSDEQKLDLWEEFTGQKLPTKTIKREGKELEVRQEPDDLEDVLIHEMLKKMEDKVEVPERVQPLTKYFQANTDIANELGTRGVAGKSGKFFSHRMWNTDYIDKNEKQAVTKMVEMMKAHPITKDAIAKGKITEEDLVQEATHRVSKILDNNIRKMFTETSYVRRAGAGDPTKKRVMKVDVTLYPEMFVRDADLVTERYSQKMSGRFAMNAIGIDATPDTHSFGDAIEKRLASVKDEGKKLGLSKKEIAKDVDNLKVAYDILMNTRQIVDNPHSLGHKTTTALRGTASAIYSGGFVKSAVGELGSIVLNTTIPSLLKSFIPAHTMAMSLLKKGNNKLAEEFAGMGIGKQIIEGNRFNRIDLEEIKAHTSWWERGLQKVGHYSRKWSGFNFITATSDFIAANAFLRDVIKASNKGSISNRFLSQLKRYGLTEQEVLDFRKKANITYYKDGKTIKELNMDSWKDQDYAWKITRAITRMVDDTILRGDGLKMPKYLTDVNSDVLRLFTQYQHFPIESYNRLLLRGMADSPARLTAATLSSTAIIYSILQLEDESLYQLGVKDERLPQAELAKRAFDKSPMAAMLPDLYNLGKNVIGQSDYYIPNISSKGFGASGNIIDTSWGLYRKALKGQHYTNRDMDKAFRLTPFSRLPIYGELGRALINKEFGE